MDSLDSEVSSDTLANEDDSFENQSYQEFMDKQERKRKRKLTSRSRLSFTSSRRYKKRKKAPFLLTTIQTLINIFISSFLLLSATGFVLSQVGFSKASPNTTSKEGDAEATSFRVVAESAVLAFDTTVQAITLWVKVLWMLFVPASQSTLEFSKVGWVALQPSIEVTIAWLGSRPTWVKVALSSILAGIISVIILFHELRRRGFFEAIDRNIFRIKQFFVFYQRKTYLIVRKRSKRFADMLGHVTYFSLVFISHYLWGDDISSFSRSIGGWVFVILLPIIFSTWSYVTYDKDYSELIDKTVANEREENMKILKKRRNSALPDSSSRAVSVGIFGNVKRLFYRGEAHNKPENDWDSNYNSIDGSRISSSDGYRPIQKATYPKALDKKDETAMEQFTSLNPVLNWVRYWCALSIVLVLEQIPIIGSILSLVPFWPNIRLFYALWLLLPFTAGTGPILEIFVLLMKKWIGAKDPQLQVKPSWVSQRVKQALSFVPDSVLSDETKADIIRGFRIEDLIYVIALISMMNNYLTSLACVLFGLVLPAWQSIKAVVSIENAQLRVKSRITKRKRASKRRKSSATDSDNYKTQEEGVNTPSVAASALFVTQWLEYWLVYTIFMLFFGLLSTFLYWIPLFDQSQIVIIVWLQAGYTRGARRVFKNLLIGFYLVRNLILDLENETSTPLAETITSGVNAVDVEDADKVAPSDASKDALAEKDHSNEITSPKVSVYDAETVGRESNTKLDSSVKSASDDKEPPPSPVRTSARQENIEQTVNDRRWFQLW